MKSPPNRQGSHLLLFRTDAGKETNTNKPLDKTALDTQHGKGNVEQGGGNYKETKDKILDNQAASHGTTVETTVVRNSGTNKWTNGTTVNDRPASIRDANSGYPAEGRTHNCVSLL